MKQKRNSSAPAINQPRKSAREVGLRYVNDNIPGIQRKRNGRSFSYLGRRNQVIRNLTILKRIKALAVPPAWTDVWICPFANGHLQATGRDARGRKQSRYHPRWREVRDETKYSHMIEFARVLPRIRRRVARDLRRRGLMREKVLATMVKLLETTHIRVGNDEYARENKSFGLTTLRDRHVKIRGDNLHFEFRGKSGKTHRLEVEDGRLARIVRNCQSIPGQELFVYVNGDGKPQRINSEDVNGYLRAISGEDVTAKDFRTWAGTVLAATALGELESFKTLSQAKRNVVRAIEEVAHNLGNTPAICRKSYVHPAIFDSYLDRSMLKLYHVRSTKAGKKVSGLRTEEVAVLELLQRQKKSKAGIA